MQREELLALSALRLEHAEECLSAARGLLASGSYKSAANRAYYTVFHAMRAVLALDGIDSKRHGGIISEFRKRYIKTGVFGSRLSDIISSSFEIRTESDYNDFYVISKSGVEEHVEDAAFFLAEIKTYLAKE